MKEKIIEKVLEKIMTIVKKAELTFVVDNKELTDEEVKDFYRFLLFRKTEEQLKKYLEDT